MHKEIEVDIRVPNQTRYLSLIGRIGEDIVNELEHYDGDRETLAYHINLVLTEAMVNAIRHANSGDPEKTVHVCITIADDELFIQVFDCGQGFDISTIPDPDFVELSESGRGIFIIRSLMHHVAYRRIDGGNVLEMRRRLS